MKHLLRKYEALASEHEAEVPDLYEAKHAQALPCGEATLHGGSRFIVHAPAARFICSSALRDKNKTHLGRRVFPFYFLITFLHQLRFWHAGHFK